jgi:hypothetical protein
MMHGTINLKYIIRLDFHFVTAYTKLRKATTSFVVSVCRPPPPSSLCLCLSLCLSTWKTWAPSKRTVMKFDV